MRGLSRLFIPVWSFLIVLLAGCSGPDSRPSGVLPRDKMQQVLWDMIEADQYSLLYLSKDSARINVKAETAARYEQVFELHKISKSEFDKSIKYYFSRPDIAKPLFDSLSAMGVRKRTEDYKNNRPAATPMHTPAAAPATPPSIPGRTAPAAPDKRIHGKTFPVIPGHGPVSPNKPVPGHPQLPPGTLPGHVTGSGSKPASGVSKPGSFKPGAAKTDTLRARGPKQGASKP